MRNFNACCFFALLAALFWLLPASAEGFATREELRSAYAALGSAPSSSPYAEAPSVAAPYAAGSLRPESLADAEAYLNFLRRLAGLEGAVALDDSLNGICQRGAVLLAALERVDHQPEKPGDMPDDFYQVASYATASSNLAGLNWMKNDILRTALEYFARDDGALNLPVLGHRRWLLNPDMALTGLGLANSASGMTYALMFAHDLSGQAEWRQICWPSPGAFPAELMHTDLAWSVTLNPEVYDLSASSPAVMIRELGSGTEYSFPYPAGDYADGYFIVNEEPYGGGPCLIFRPDLKKADLEEYLQNQRWEVRVTGLKYADGGDAELRYVTEMAALRAIDAASVEISRQELALRPGETAELSAEVVPSWADDVSVTWSSSDTAVARVDGTGTVTAVGPGACQIIAESANRRWDVCAVTVAE